jgi:hypothetical protein
MKLMPPQWSLPLPYREEEVYVFQSAMLEEA